jgi:hypothetical protein
VKHARRMFVWTLILVVRDSAPTTAWDRTSGTQGGTSACLTNRTLLIRSSHYRVQLSAIQHSTRMQKPFRRAVLMRSHGHRP